MLRDVADRAHPRREKLRVIGCVHSHGACPTLSNPPACIAAFQSIFWYFDTLCRCHSMTSFHVFTHVDALVAFVEQDRQPAAGAEHPMDLGERLVERNQWNACATVTRVDRLVGERDRLGGAVEHLDVGQRPRQLRSHARDRLDGDDVGARCRRAAA